MLFDILIPYYGNTSEVEKTVTNLLEDDFIKMHVRIVLVDNCSDEKINPTFLARYKGNLEYHRNLKNLGRINNWNECLKYVESDWFAFLFLGDKFVNLKSLIEQLKSNSDGYSILCFRMCIQRGTELKKIGKYLFNLPGIYSGEELIKRYLSLGLMPWGPLQCNAFKKEIIDGCYFDIDDDYYADIKFILSAMKRYNIKLIKSVHLHWNYDPNRTHFKISLADFIVSDFKFITNSISFNKYGLFRLKSILVIRALIMAKHYGFKSSFTAISRLLQTGKGDI